MGCSRSWLWALHLSVWGLKEYRPTLVFRIVNGGQVPQEVVETAKTHVEHIYGHSGIQVEWVDGDEANQPSNGNGKLDLTMIFVPESVAQIMNRPKEATGFAVSNDGGAVAGHTYSLNVSDSRRSSFMTRLHVK